MTKKVAKSKAEIEEAIRMKIHNNKLMQQWRRKMFAAQKRVIKYRTNKRKFAKEIADLKSELKLAHAA